MMNQEILEVNSNKTVIVKPLATPAPPQKKVIAPRAEPVGFNFLPLRQELLDLGVITVPSSILTLPKDDLRRVAYERKLILQGDL